MRQRGLVLGKFLPPHLGHLYLIEFAQRCVDELAIVVGTLAAEPIDGELRYQWLCELAPGATVLHLTDDNPQAPQEHPDFWQIWEASLRRILPWIPDLVFASEPYGARLAEIFGARFVPVDIHRSVMPVSGSAIRKRPLHHWSYLPRCVRSHYVKRISLFGAESSGKTTLAQALGRHYETVVVPEYARTHLEAQGGRLSASDIPLISQRQHAAEQALSRSANRLLICDTDPLLTCIWSEALFGEVPVEVADRGAAGRYDLTLLCDAEVPFEADPVRYLPDQRQAFQARCKAQLGAHGRHFVELTGGPEERLRLACAHIDRLLESLRRLFIDE